MKLKKLLLCAVFVITVVLTTKVPVQAGGDIYHGTIEHYVDCPYCGEGKGGSKIILPGSTHTFVLKAPDGTIHTDDYATWDHNVAEDNNLEGEASFTFSNPRGCFVDITANSCGQVYLNATTCTTADSEDIKESTNSKSAHEYDNGGITTFYVKTSYTFVNEQSDDIQELVVGDSIQFITTLYNADNPQGTPLNISKEVYEDNGLAQEYFNLSASGDSLIAKTVTSHGFLLRYFNILKGTDPERDDSFSYHYRILSDSKVYTDSDTIRLEPTRDNSKVIRFVPSKSGTYGFFTKNTPTEDFESAYIDDLRIAETGTRISAKRYTDASNNKLYVVNTEELTAGTEYIVEIANLNSSTEDYVLAPYPYTWPANKTSGADETTETENTPAGKAAPLAKGKSFVKNNLKYKVTSSLASSPTVAFTGISSTKITSVKIPATITDSNGIVYKVTSVADNALKKKTKVKTVSVGSNVTAIGSNAFYGCTKLTKVTITGSKLVTIGKNAFYGDKALSTLTMSKAKSLKTIGATAFKNCKKLKTLKLVSTKLTKNTVKKSLSGSSIKTITVPSKMVKKYKTYFVKKNSGKTVTVK